MDGDQNDAPTTAAVKGILKLSSNIRKKIFQAVLVVRHELHVFQDPGGPAEVFAPDAPRHWHALLHTNRQISQDAATVLYGLNTFSFMETTGQESGVVAAFLHTIGPRNADMLSHVCIDFPVIEESTFKLREDGSRTLQFLQQSCSSLRTLEFYVSGKNSNGLTNPSETNADAVQNKLQDFNARLRAIRTLSKIVVRFFVGRPTPSAMHVMQDLGWTVLPAHNNQW